MSFFMVPNVVSSAATEIEAPWSYIDSHIPESLILSQDKAAYRQWCANPATKHAFVFACEGVDPRRRPSYTGETGNPVFKVHGLIADFDAQVTQDHIAKVQSHPPSPYLPVYFNTTFTKGHMRGFWNFEAPVMVANEKQLKKFLAIAQKELRCHKWAAGFEEAAFLDPCHIYCLGSRWFPLFPDAVIPTAILQFWLVEAAKQVVMDENPTITTPDLPMIRAEIDRRWPGRWSGPFDIGCRGPRFWDPSATDPTGAVVLQFGMYAFSGEQAFIPWKSLLGVEWATRIEADKVAYIRDRVAYDGSTFYVYHKEENLWKPMDRPDMSQWLRVNGLSAKKINGAASELDRAEVDMKLNRRVTRVCPLLYFPPGICIHENERWLNTSKVKPLTPAPAGIEGGAMTVKHFPFIYKFVSTLFGSDAVGVAQLDHLLGWLQHFYASALAGQPRPGQAVYMIGPAGKGKTLFARKIVGALAGGFASGKNLIDGTTPWNDNMLDMPIIMLDDELGPSDTKALTRFSSILKQLVASGSMTYNARFRKSSEVPWFGRVMINANTDSASLRILPDMEQSTTDKISLFRTSDESIPFPDMYTIERTLAQELPNFARWLLEWPCPDYVKSDKQRFGVNSYHHPGLLSRAHQQGVGGMLLELLEGFLPGIAQLQDRECEPYWTGTLTQLYRDLCAFDSNTMRHLNPRGLATALSNLSARGFNIQQQHGEGGRRTLSWKIGLDVAAQAGQIEREEQAPQRKPEQHLQKELTL